MNQNTYDSIKNSSLNFMLKVNKKRSFTNKYTFEDRSKNSENLCIILSGYKQFTWDIIFKRIDKFSQEDMDICIVSSGIYSEELSNIAKKYNWSYLSLKKNSVCLAANCAIEVFPNAKYIYKLDEDIFITKDFFKTLKKTYETVQEKEPYNVGFVAPIIPINGCSHVLLLEKLGLTEYYEEHFEKVKFATGKERMIEHSAEVAEFMWGKDDIVPHIDEINEQLLNSPFSYYASPVKFSIGAILFTREIWEDMHYFSVILGNGLGHDEIKICAYCMNFSKAIIVSKNSCVGHLSFGKQNKVMEEYFKSNINRFDIKESDR